MLDQEQQPMPEELNAFVEAFIGVWDSGEHGILRTHLQRATALAQQMGYL